LKISFLHISRRFLIALIPTLITYNTLLFYGFPGNSIFYILLSLWFLVYLCMSWKKGLLLACLLLGATVLLNSLLGLMDVEERIYYGTHERLKVYNSELELDSYRKNVDISVLMPFGDTIAMGTEKNIETEPRKIRFRTDSLGFRNDGDYRGQKYVLVGDSLVMGGGTSQEDTLAAQLRDKYGVDTYSLTYAGGILEYVKCILYFKKKCKTDFRVLMFLFEGNDFAEGFSRRQFVLKKPFMRAQLDWYFSLYKRTILYRYTYILMNRGSERPFPSETITVNGHRMGEFSEYIRVSRREAYRYPEPVMERVSLVADRIDHIFFIPTKFRVYYSFLQPPHEQPLPNAQWEAAKELGEKFGIPCTDLTGPMIEESAILLKKGKYTYWKDDSHWNRYGIGVAAKVVAEQLKVKK
jgi:hypothetical protein